MELVVIAETNTGRLVGPDSASTNTRVAVVTRRMVASPATPRSWPFWSTPEIQVIVTQITCKQNSPVLHHGLWASFSWCRLSDNENEEGETEESTLPMLTKDRIISDKTTFAQQHLHMERPKPCKHGTEEYSNLKKTKFVHIILKLPSKYDCWSNQMNERYNQKRWTKLQKENAPSSQLVQLKWGMGIYWSVCKLGSGRPTPGAAGVQQ